MVKKWGPGYVYLMQAQGTSFYKIGHATNVEKRWYSIDAACPLPVIIIHKVYVNIQTEGERYWHSLFRSRRIKGEWFDLSEEHVQLFMMVKGPDVDTFGYQIFFVNGEFARSLEGLG